jgi:glyoxylase-like metal-dependent hydrolase (beta-lactamase superfamily II)
MHLQHLADDIFLVPLPLPFALNRVNCYLVRDGAGWMIIDTGLHTEAGELAWDAAFAELGIGLTSVSRILVTHHHPDHIGMAGWLQARTGAPVLMAPREAELARLGWARPEAALGPMDSLFAAHGTPPEARASILVELTKLWRGTQPLPTITPHPHGEPLVIGQRKVATLHAPGHSDGQLLLFDEADGLLFSGDQVLLQITPHIGVWPSSEPNPLGRYLASLAQLAELPVRLALPGHRQPITDWAGRIAELQAHHEARLAQMLALVEAGATTAYEVARQAFPFERYTPHEMRFAVAETIAHLELLAARGAL